MGVVAAEPRHPLNVQTHDDRKKDGYRLKRLETSAIPLD